MSGAPHQADHGDVSLASAVAVTVVGVWLGMVPAIVILVATTASPPSAGAALALAAGGILLLSS